MTAEELQQIIREIEKRYERDKPKRKAEAA